MQKQKWKTRYFNFFFEESCIKNRIIEIRRILLILETKRSFVEIEVIKFVYLLIWEYYFSNTYTINYKKRKN